MWNLMSAARHAAERLARQWIVTNSPVLGHETPRGLERLRRWALSGVLGLVDRRLERQFDSLLACAMPTYATNRDRPLLIALIGTLGPGGTERQLVNSLLGLKSRYVVDLEVVAMHLENESQRFFVDVLEHAGIPVTRIDRSTGLVFPGDDSSAAARRLRHAMRTHLHPKLDHISAYTSVFLSRRPDVVHLWLDDVNTKAGLGAALAGVPRIVLSTRSVNPSHFPLYQPYMRAAYRSLLRLPQIVVLNNSEAGAGDYTAWIGCQPGRITVLRNGLRIDDAAPAQGIARGETYRARWNIPAGALVLGGLMRLSEEKRPLLWVEVAEAVAARCPDVYFLLVGDGVQRPLVHTRIADSPFANRFRCVGHEAKPYDSLLAMKVLFLSSAYEGSPNVLIEAQALGVPVVTMPAGGAVEVVDEGRTGWVVHDGSVAAAIECITHLMTHPAELTAAAAAGPDWVRTRFDLDRMIDETAAAYGGLQRSPCSGSPGPTQISR